MLDRRDNHRMSERELCRYRRIQRLRRARRQRLLKGSAAVLAAIGMVLIGSVSYRAIDSNANSGYKYYTGITVNAGDTLWDIADSYIDYDYYKNKNSYITEVKQINHLETDEITDGQTLIVPYYSSEFVY